MWLQQRTGGENCTVSRLKPGTGPPLPLFLKESLTFHRPVLKWGVGRMLPGAVGLEETSSEAEKCLSLFTVMEILSDLEASLALSQVERWGGVG